MSWCGDTTPKAAENVSVTLRSQQGGEGVGVAHEGEGPCYENHAQDSRVKDCGDTSPTIHGKSGTGGNNLPLVRGDKEPVAFTASDRSNKAAWTSEVHGSLNCQIDSDSSNLQMGVLQQGEPVAPSLTASNNPSRSPQSSEVTRQVEAVHSASMIVRRLTPTECERLQGFPDHWTEEREELELIDNQWHATPITHPQADGPRYKQLGNAVTVNVAKWLGMRLMKNT